MKRNTDYTPHLLIGLLLFATVVNLPGCYSDNIEDTALPIRYGASYPPPPYKLIKHVTDQRNLTSIILAAGTDTVAFDYLKPNEVDSIADAYNVHICYDYTHRDCDGFCTCDGLGCPKLTDTILNDNQ